MRKAGIILVAAAIAAVFGGDLPRGRAAGGRHRRQQDPQRLRGGPGGEERRWRPVRELKKNDRREAGRGAEDQGGDRQAEVMLGKEKLKEKEDALQAKLNELRTADPGGGAGDADPAGRAHREVLKSVEAKVDVVVKADKIDLVLEKSAGVIHFNESMDITKRVLALVNEGGKAAPQKKAEPEKKGAGGGK